MTGFRQSESSRSGASEVTPFARLNLLIAYATTDGMTATVSEKLARALARRAMA